MISLKDYLVSVFGEDNVTEEPVPQLNLIYMFRQYSYESFRIFGRQFMFLYWAEWAGMEQYMRQIPILEKEFGLPFVLVVENAFEAQIKNLMDLGLRFVEPGRQVCIPMPAAMSGKAAEPAPAGPQQQCPAHIRGGI